MKAEIPATHTHRLAVKDGYWGRSTDANKARGELRKQTDDIKGATIYAVPPDYWIDEYGAGHGSGNAVLISGPDRRE